MLVLVALIVFLPETQRSIAGNGSVTLSGPYIPLAYLIRRPLSWNDQHEATSTAVSKPQPKQKETACLNFKKAFAPMTYALEKDIAVLVILGAAAYTAWSMVTSSTTATLLNSFPNLSSWQIGLCSVSNGFGCVASSICTGWLMDQSFKSTEYRFKMEKGMESDDDIKDMADFPMVRARLKLMPYCSTTLVVCLALYGPSYEFNVIFIRRPANLAAPLILQFLIAFTATAIFNMNSTLLIDCFPDRPAIAAALNSLFRCVLGAAGVSAIQPLINAVKPTKAFAIVASALFLSSILVWVEWKWGEKWKREREERLSSSNMPPFSDKKNKP